MEVHTIREARPIRGRHGELHPDILLDLVTGVTSGSFSGTIVIHKAKHTAKYICYGKPPSESASARNRLTEIGVTGRKNTMSLLPSFGLPLAAGEPQRGLNRQR